MTDPDWAGIEAAYRDNDLTVVEIVTRFGISQKRLYTHAKRQGWPKRRRRLPVRGAVLDPIAKSDDPSLAMLARLSRALGAHINELEAAIANPARTDKDREREAKVLAALAQVLDKLMQLAAKLETADPAAKDTAADHDRIVAAIAERVARLGNERTAGALLSESEPQRS